MKENKISVEIQCPVSEVFGFTLNPANTSKWIAGIEKEETSEWPVKVGSIYRNETSSGVVNEYVLTALEEDTFFELASKEGGYHVRYTFTPISEHSSSMEYFEWMDEGVLENPFPQSVLNTLKIAMES